MIHVPRQNCNSTNFYGVTFSLSSYLSSLQCGYVVTNSKRQHMYYQLFHLITWERMFLTLTLSLSSNVTSDNNNMDSNNSQSYGNFNIFWTMKETNCQRTVNHGWDVVRFSSGYLRHQRQLTKNRKYPCIRTNDYRRFMINGYHNIHLNEGQTPYGRSPTIINKTEKILFYQ